NTGLSPTAGFARLALPVTMDSGRVVAVLPFAVVRFAGFRPAGLGVLSVLRARMGVTGGVEVYRPHAVASAAKRAFRIHRFAGAGRFVSSGQRSVGTRRGITWRERRELQRLELHANSACLE